MYGTENDTDTPSNDDHRRTSNEYHPEQVVDPDPQPPQPESQDSEEEEDEGLSEFPVKYQSVY
jgi:hypothetical protein